MPEVLIDIDLVCAQCGSSLTGKVESGRLCQEIVVEPCAKCMDDAAQEGFLEGYDKGSES